MLKYEEVKGLIFAHCTIPDGYNGDKKRVGIAYCPSHLITCFVTDSGYFHAPVADCMSREDVIHYLKSHMSCKHVTRIKILEDA